MDIINNNKPIYCEKPLFDYNKIKKNILFYLIILMIF